MSGFAALTQSKFHGGVIPAGGWFSKAQAAAMGGGSVSRFQTAGGIALLAVALFYSAVNTPAVPT
ncbi:hypothetical protein FRC01_002296 [Tulasnella sp. 417]|nr:hypothetical protein FRC01_002296 [Tulasnella sp. 417]